MKTLLGRIMRTASTMGDGTMSFVEDSVYSLWLANNAYNWMAFQYTVNYMAPVGMNQYYGFWAIPEKYARAVIGQPDNANESFWVYLGSVYETGGIVDPDQKHPIDFYGKGIKGIAPPIREAYSTGPTSNAYGLCTKQRNRIVLSDVAASEPTGTSNKGVFLTSNDNKSIRLQSYNPNNTNDAIIISNETNQDNITLTGSNSTRPIGPRGATVDTGGNVAVKSRAANLRVQVGLRGSPQEAAANGRKLVIQNCSLAEGPFSQNSLGVGKFEGNGSITIQSDHNDIEILSLEGRLLIKTSQPCQIESDSHVNVLATGDINLQSREGDINLKALTGGVNIESGQKDIALQSGGGGVIHLNKIIPGSFSSLPVVKEFFNDILMNQ